jgi:hypothetical protein
MIEVLSGEGERGAYCAARWRSIFSSSSLTALKIALFCSSMGTQHVMQSLHLGSSSSEIGIQQFDFRNKSVEIKGSGTTVQGAGCSVERSAVQGSGFNVLRGAPDSLRQLDLFRPGIPVF